MVSLEIRQTFAKIGIHTAPSHMEIETKRAKLNIHQGIPVLNMESKKTQLKIDSYDGFSAIGMKNYSDAAKEAAQRAKQQVLNYISQTAADGERLAQIEKGGNPIKEIAVRKAWPEKMRAGQYIPVHSPKFSCVIGGLKITPPKVKNAEHIGYSAEYIPGYVKYKYTPAKVEIRMLRWPSIQIDVKL